MIGGQGDVSHADLLAEVKAFREEMAPLIEMKPDLKEVVEIMQALRIGGKGLNWLAGIVKAALVIGGLWLAFKAGLASVANGG